ncbi:juvenile hormone esterase-like [Plodia interpunctella]|uniref:juvenile hormone esterase-like n=1 Tax=Plodia interpunctella TaxID=58824 RepID=UPI002367D2E2|nr:juvenile hormone esterase-like [Plodia interpunctella]
MGSCKVIIFLFYILFANVFADLRIDPLVDTNVGLIRGLRAIDGDYSMFMGIPFAKVRPENPFGDAIPHERFDDVFEAFDDSAICPQIEEFNQTVTGNLDCLHLNIYVPNSASSRNRLPVLIWVYGGGFSIGFSGRYLYGPKYIVRHDVILVTINYRLGPYGFMCLDTADVPGNQGLKDQLLALRWVKHNIEAFGGDSNKITAFGESAGGIAVDFHLLSPHELLFNQVILNSGTTLLPTFYEPIKNAPIILAQYLGLDTDDMDEAISFLANLDTNSVITAAAALNLEFKTCVEQEFDNVDRFITQNWINAPVPKVRNMPVLIGFNNQELLTTYGLETATFYDDLIKYKLSIGFDVDNEEFEGMEELVRQFYIGDESITDKVRYEIIDFESDYKFNHPTFRSIKKYIENGAGNIFNYVFSYAGGRNFAKHLNNITFGGAAHADELGYLFDMSFWKQISDEDQLIVDLMTTMWTNFVKHGDPTPELSDLLTTKWTPITEGSPHHYLEIDRELHAKTRPFSSRMTFWDLFYKMNHNLQRIYPGYNV